VKLTTFTVYFKSRKLTEDEINSASRNVRIKFWVLPQD